MVLQIILLLNTLFWGVSLLLVTTGTVVTSYSAELYMIMPAIFTVGLAINSTLLTSNK